ncbi:MAG TPA: mannosyltransferase [Mycobacterium sp.]|jgi:alpha-1,2-mannosyltransferase
MSRHRLALAAPLLLALSIGARLAWTYLLPNGANFVDLHVYVGGAATIGTGHALYEFVYANQTPEFPLPFVYPPFAAVVFYPLHLLPFGLVGLLWQLASIAALYASVRVSQSLLAPLAEPGSRLTAMLWTAIGIWTEPVRGNLDYGQINVMLMLAVLMAIYSARWWSSGILVGLAAGMKVTPAISGLYFVGARRWSTAACSVAVFAATVAVSALVIGDQVRYYFTHLIGAAGQTFPIGTVTNQTWYGGISRILGHDAGFGWPVVAAVVATALLTFLAWRAIDERDRLGRIIVVMVFGLLVSPISWTHHWVWLLPMTIWLIYGAARKWPGGNVIGWCWLVLTVVGPTWLLGFAQPSQWQIGRPWYLAWAGLVYILAAVATLAWIAVTGRRSRRSVSPS